jgi:ribosomal protein S18 acetylase RimI-like enzyme
MSSTQEKIHLHQPGCHVWRNSLKIKTIGREDINIIRSLWESLNAHHLSKSTYFKDHFSKFTFEKRMATLKKREHFNVCVAQDKDEPIGYCIATVDGLIGEIDSLFVKAQYRRQGIGNELTTLALKWLEDLNCEIMRVAIAEGNENALDFYRRFGFAERFVVMQRMHNHRAIRAAKKSKDR